jgi:acyl-CoA reductase-like NAD-dependent aldehyde dehydrogenase
VKRQRYDFLDEVESEQLQEQLNRIAAKASDRKDELVDLLNEEQPTKSRLVDAAYLQCIWWEGCYYCQMQDLRWYRVKCFT